MMMRLLLCLLQILFLMWVSLIEHYWVILRERRSGKPVPAMVRMGICANLPVRQDVQPSRQDR
jgi:hypothetical protein